MFKKLFFVKKIHILVIFSALAVICQYWCIKKLFLRQISRRVWRCIQNTWRFHLYRWTTLYPCFRLEIL